MSWLVWRVPPPSTYDPCTGRTTDRAADPRAPRELSSPYFVLDASSASSACEQFAALCEKPGTYTAIELNRVDIGLAAK